MRSDPPNSLLAARATSFASGRRDVGFHGPAALPSDKVPNGLSPTRRFSFANRFPKRDSIWAARDCVTAYLRGEGNPGDDVELKEKRQKN